MNKVFCDKCNKEVLLGGVLVYSDKSFNKFENGAVWSIECNSNYMNKRLDVCYDCKKEAIKLILNETYKGPR